jgi:hypothetical protein
LNKLPVPGPIAKAEAEIKFEIEGEIIIKGTIIRDKGYSNKEYRFSKLAGINMSAIGDKIISNTEIFANTISY